MTRTPLRRAGVFLAVFLPGISFVAWAGGGVLVPERGEAAVATAKAATPGGPVVAVDKAALGPGRRGRMDRDSVAVVGNRAVPWREWSAEWRTSEPQAPPEHGVSLLKLTDARIVLFREPDASHAPSLREDVPGTTIVSGREALLRQREDAPPSARLEGDAAARHVLDDGDAMTLRSDVLEFRTEEREAGRVPVRILETERDVRIEGGGAALDGRGLTAEFERERRRARIERDVRGTLAGRDGRAPATWRCDGPAFLEALERPGRDGRQPWRATFREDVSFEDAAGALTADEAIVEFVRTTEADRRAGARATEVRKVTANGDVVVEGTRAAGSWRATSDRMRRWAEDVLTDVCVFEGSPVFTFEARPADGKSAPSLHEIRCTGPATLRTRRARLGSDDFETATVVFEGDVEAREFDAATKALRSELLAPRVTVEARRGAEGGIDPRLVRAEGGAKLRRTDLAATAKTAVWTARRSDAEEHIALVGDPVVTHPEREGVNPFGGEARPGLLALSAGERIDVDLAPPRPGEARSSGASRIEARGGMTARKIVDGKDAFVVTSDRGDARFGEDGSLSEIRASGRARLRGKGDGEGAREGDVAGDRLVITRRADAPAGPSRARDMDAVVFGSADETAVAVLEVPDGRNHELRARELRSEQGGAVVLAIGGASADLAVAKRKDGAAPSRRSEGGGLRITADRIRADVDRKDGERARLRLLTADGTVTMWDAQHRLTGDRATYEEAAGRAEVQGRPARILRLEPKDPERSASWLAGPVIRAFFDRDAERADRFLRATCPKDGELVAYHVASPDGSASGRDRERVTIQSQGPMDLEPAAASALGNVVVVWERRMPDGSWFTDSRVDCRRMEATFERGDGIAPRDALRTLLATGTPDVLARIQSSDPRSRRSTLAMAERIEVSQGATTVRCTCPSGENRVSVHEISAGRRWLCDAVTYNYRTYEWTDTVRLTEVE
jgi:hypothetical protein